MASQTPGNPPPSPTQPPPPPAPGPGASRDEWRAWRRAQRDYYGWHGPWSWGSYGPWWWGGHGVWGWFWPAALVVIGVYALLSNLNLLTWLRGDVLWPSLLILFGLLLLVSRARRW